MNTNRLIELNRQNTINLLSRSGKTPKEIAKIVGIGPWGVRSLLRKAKKASPASSENSDTQDAEAAS